MIKSPFYNRSFSLLLMAVFGSFGNSFSQDTTNATIDSLIVLLMNDAEDTAKADVYNALSAEYVSLDYTSSAEYGLLGYNLSKKLKYQPGILRSSLLLGHLNIAYYMDFGRANDYFNEALGTAQILSDRESELIALNGLSKIHRNVGNFDQAISYNKKALEIAVELDNYRYQSDLNASLGAIYEEDGNKNAAIDAYAEVLAIERKYDFVATTNGSMIAIARYYLLIEDLGQALKYYRIALKSFERTGDNRWTSYTHSEMALLYIQKKDLKRAEQHAKKGEEIANKFELKKELGDNYLALIEIYKAMDSTSLADEYTRAYDSLQESIKLDIPATATLPEKTEKPAQKQAVKMNGFLQSIIIMIPVILLILFAGRPSFRKK